MITLGKLGDSLDESDPNKSEMGITPKSKTIETIKENLCKWVLMEELLCLSGNPLQLNNMKQLNVSTLSIFSLYI